MHPPVGRYEVVRPLAKGGQGVVLLGRAPSGEQVAIKLLGPQTGRQEVAARFDRERRLLSELGEAQGFVPLLDAGTCERGPYIVMPFLPAGTLRDRLAQGALRFDQALTITRRLAAALGRAHALGVVHRDIKPENVHFTGALEDQSVVLELDPRHLTAWINRGTARSKLGDEPGAIEDWTHARTLAAPGSPAAEWLDRKLTETVRPRR